MLPNPTRSSLNWASSSRLLSKAGLRWTGEELGFVGLGLAHVAP